MTTIEFSNEFDIKWDNLRYNNSDTPSLNDYEKSVFLTTAQENWIMKNYDSYENTEFIRKALSPIVKSKSESGYFANTTDSSTIITNINNSVTGQARSITFSLPTDLWLVTHEQLKMGLSKSVEVVPITHDEWNVIKNNPFRSVTPDRAFRLDRDSKVEIIYHESLDAVTMSYYYVYVRRPKPIVLDGVYETGDNTLEIRGQIDPQTSELNDIVHETILEDALMLASQSLINSNNH